MMPENDRYGGWAASGEIDIMENAGGSPYKIGGAIHYGGLGQRINSKLVITIFLLVLMRQVTTNMQ